MTYLSRKLFAVLVACATSVAPAFAAAPDPYPSKPVRILVPFPPGGSADIFARLVGQKLHEAWEQPVIVENKPGAGGQIATQAAVNAPADGHTLLVVTVGHAVNPVLYSNLPYDTEKDLRPVASLARLPSMLVVHPSLPARSVKELIALARARPGKLTYASAGNGGTSHVAGAMFASMADVDIMHVPYRGSPPAVADLIGGHVDFMFDPIASSAQHVRDGKLRALAVSTAERTPLAADLPTMAEAGVPGYDFSAWFLMLAPSGVPDAIVDALNEKVGEVLAAPEVRARYESLGAEPGSGKPDELSAFLRNEIERLSAVARDAGMNAQ